MCSNRALVNSLECYMDELVESFEDFVKTSLFMISLGVCTVVGMFVFMVKKLMQRSGRSAQSINSSQYGIGTHFLSAESQNYQQQLLTPSNNQKRTMNQPLMAACQPLLTTNNVQSAATSTTTCSKPHILTASKSLRSTSTQHVKPTLSETFNKNKGVLANKILPMCSSVAEVSLGETELNSSSKACSYPSSICPNSLSRMTIPSLNPCFRRTSNKSITKINRSSCCSTCCKNDKKCN